jgi:hypothetical protein
MIPLWSLQVFNRDAYLAGKTNQRKEERETYSK